MIPLPEHLLDDFKLAKERAYNPNTLNKIFETAVLICGIKKKGRTLHCLRHSYALREYWRTRDIHHVQRRLGHSSVQITEEYLQYPDEYLEQVFGDSSTDRTIQTLITA